MDSINGEMESVLELTLGFSWWWNKPTWSRTTLIRSSKLFRIILQRRDLLIGKRKLQPIGLIFSLGDFGGFHVWNTTKWFSLDRTSFGRLRRCCPLKMLRREVRRSAKRTRGCVEVSQGMREWEDMVSTIKKKNNYKEIIWNELSLSPLWKSWVINYRN